MQLVAYGAQDVPMYHPPLCTICSVSSTGDRWLVHAWGTDDLVSAVRNEHTLCIRQARSV